jgi:Uma2 family endonuclease
MVHSPQPEWLAMTLQQLREFAEGRIQMVPLTVEQYHRMIETGILEEGEPIELLDGFLVRKDRSKAGGDPMTVGPDHAAAIDLLGVLNSKLLRRGCYIRIQQPLTLPPDDEPEPDGAIVRGKPGTYQGRHPGGSDVLCAIEVADSSLRQDRTTKQRIYADHAIPCFVIVNLPDRVLEVYVQPLPGQGRYAHMTTLRAKQRLEFVTPDGKKLALPVSSLLP